MTNERGNALRRVHMLSSPATPEFPNWGGWQVVAKLDQRGIWGRSSWAVWRRKVRRQQNT